MSPARLPDDDELRILRLRHERVVKPVDPSPKLPEDPDSDREPSRLPDDARPSTKEDADRSDAPGTRGPG
jgi:hypothetical protein